MLDTDGTQEAIKVLLVAEGAKLEMLKVLISGMPDIVCMRAVRSVDAALNFLETALPDVVYIAHRSGDAIDGLALLRVLHAHLPGLPVIFDTIDRLLLPEARALGAVHCVQQPILPRQIVQSIRDVYGIAHT